MFTIGATYVGGFLFLYREDIHSGEKFFQVMHLPSPFNAVTNNTCVPIANFYFTKYKSSIAIDKADEKILKRWVVNSDNKQVHSVIFGETKHVCFVYHYSNHSHI